MLADTVFPTYKGWFMQWEMDMLWWINANWHGVTWINYIFYIISFVCDSGIIWFVLGIVMLFFKKWRRTGIIMLSGLIIVTGLNNFCIKIIADRARPFYYNDLYSGTQYGNPAYDLYLFVQNMFSLNDGKGLTFLGIGGIPDKQSFMSGHTISSFVCATIIFMYHRKVGIGALAFASIVAFSRVFLCVHWPTDVIFGALFAIGSAIGVYYLGDFLYNKAEVAWQNHKAKKQNVKPVE